MVSKVELSEHLFELLRSHSLSVVSLLLLCLCLQPRYLVLQLPDDLLTALHPRALPHPVQDDGELDCQLPRPLGHLPEVTGADHCRTCSLTPIQGQQEQEQEEEGEGEGEA